MFEKKGRIQKDMDKNVETQKKLVKTSKQSPVLEKFLLDNKKYATVRSPLQELKLVSLKF